MGGKVGPFFYKDGKIYSDSVDNEIAEEYGEFKTWGNHSDFWDVLSKKYPRFQYMEYYECPRGRVTYNYVKNKFHIYLNPRLNNMDILEKIIHEYNLDGLSYIVDDTDEHYQI